MPIYRPNTVVTNGSVSGSGLPSDPLYLTNPLSFANSKISGRVEHGNVSSSGNWSHAHGDFATASADIAYSQGYNTLARGVGSHAEGITTTASGNYAHSEGQNTLAFANASHAEGIENTSSGLWSHVEGHGNISIGQGSHAEGRLTIASGSYSHAQGYGTIASGAYQAVAGQYNKQGNSTSLFIVGNGSGDGTRSDILLVNNDAVIVSGTSNTILDAISNVNDFSEINSKNINAGAAASSDIVATANNGNDTQYYINMGINSSGYIGGTVGTASDGYLYNTGSNLWIGNSTPNKNIYFFAGGLPAANTTAPTLMVSASNNGISGRVGIGTNSPTAELAVSGNIDLSGSLRFGASTQGIIFAGNTGVGSISAYTLNDYEEGTWTPGFAAADAGATFSGVSASGSYVKIGNLVTCFGFLAITGSSATVVSGTSGFSALNIIGLPYSSRNSSDIFGGMTVYRVDGFEDITEFNGNFFIGEIQNNGNKVTKITYNANGTNTYLNISSLFSGSTTKYVRNGTSGTKPLKMQFMLKYQT
jgi:hypothetical protein